MNDQRSQSFIKICFFQIYDKEFISMKENVVCKLIRSNENVYTTLQKGDYIILKR